MDVLLKVESGDTLREHGDLARVKGDLSYSIISNALEIYIAGYLQQHWRRC